MGALTRRLFGFLPAAALVAAIGANPVRAETVKFGFTGSPTALSLPYFVAKKKGWLADLVVEEVYVTGDSNAMRVLLSGGVDIATVGTVNVLAAVEAGAKVKAISSWQPIVDYNLVIAKGKGTEVNDLVGKTIATSGPGGMPDALPRLIMRHHNVDASASRFIQVGGHAARLQAIIGGRADAAIINFATVSLGGDRVVVAARVAQEFPKLGYVWNVVREESLADPRLAKIYQVLTEATIRGARFIMENPGEAAQILHDNVPDLSLDICQASILEMNKEKVWGVDGGLDPEVAKFTATLSSELKILKANIEPEQFLEPKFVDAALKVLGPAN